MEVDLNKILHYGKIPLSCNFIVTYLICNKQLLYTAAATDDGNRNNIV